MMKLKNILGIIAISALAASCSEDTMDRINKDNAHPGLNVVSAKFQLTDAEVSSVYNINCADMSWYVASYTEQIFGTGNNQLKNAELRSTNETAASATFDNNWNQAYTNLFNLKTIIQKCQEGGNSAGQLDILGMAQTLAAYNWGIMTDMFGNIPCSEALGDVSNPKLDSQEDIYKHIIELLDAAKGNFDQAIESNLKNAGSQDILLNNDLQQWRGLAHALKARYLLHEMGRDNSVLATVLAETDAAVADGFEGVSLDVFDGDAQVNPWTAFWWSREYSGTSKTVDDLMVARQDPREALYNTDAFGTNTIGIPGNKEQAGLTEAINTPAWFENGAASCHMFSKSELYFIRAEVKARLGQDATTDFHTAVEASMEDYAYASDTKIAAEDVAAYLAGEVATKFAANPLSEILVQKYIAQTRDEQLETFNDMRRCEYVDGSYPVKMTNPNNTTSGGANRLPLRLPYGSSDVISNPNVKAAFGSGNDAGMYIFTDKIWWAGGDR